ncbi:MAG: hypothetical protein JWM47_905 [Acidimicrobiales bacterium]|nr:hypothetical protein [Acidimicrobiales bacterium]
MRARRRPAALVWLLAVPFAVLVGLAIAGSPFVDRDVPLRDRGVDARQLDVDTPTATAPGG